MERCALLSAALPKVREGTAGTARHCLGTAIESNTAESVLWSAVRHRQADSAHTLYVRIASLAVNSTRHCVRSAAQTNGWATAVARGEAS